MQNGPPKAILNTSLPAQFRRIRIELAREKGHPEGDAGLAYVLIAPLGPDDRIDTKLWREHREACRVTKLRPDERARHGHLAHRGGGWAFHYEDAPGLPDEIAYHLADERFVAGEYVSVSQTGKMHTYRVAAVSRL